MSLGVTAFSIFDPELARLCDQLREASTRLERVKREHSAESIDYQVARLGFKQALAAMAAYASSLPAALSALEPT